MSGSIHPPAVLVGGLVALAIAVPAAILAQVLDEAGTLDDQPAWLVVSFLVILVGMGTGGHVAGARARHAPLTNSALAALGAYAVVQGIGAIRLLVVDEPVTWAAIPFFALLSSAAGMTGGLVADRRTRSTQR